MNRNFATVPLSKVLEKGIRPHINFSAPYLLVVDDEYAIANNFAIILRNVGYEVTVAYDAESAVQIAELAPPELVITDFSLPGMDGVEFALRLKKLIPVCKLFFITGMPEEAAGAVGARSPAHHFRILAKPVHPAELLQCVSELLACDEQAPQLGCTAAD